MKSSLQRLSVFLLILAVVPGVVVSLGGLWAVWRLEGRVAQTLETTADLTLRTLTTTSALLDAVAGSLDEVQSNLTLIRGSVDEISDTLSTTVNVTGQIGALVGDELTTIIEDTQSSLKAVQSSARLIDDTLAIVTMLPLIGSRYTPETPLEKSVGRVYTSLDGVPASLRQIQSELTATSKSLASLQQDVQKLGGELGHLEEDLETARQSVAEYQRILKQLTGRLSEIRPAIAGWVRAVAIALTVLCVWVLLTQAALLLQVLANAPVRVETAGKVGTADQAAD